MQDFKADTHIDALGCKANNYERDGLRAVAHFGGKGGLKNMGEPKASATQVMS